MILCKWFIQQKKVNGEFLIDKKILLMFWLAHTYSHSIVQSRVPTVNMSHIQFIKITINY